MNRWIIVVGAILIQLCLGAIYAWSVFTTPLAAPLPDETFTNAIGDEIIIAVDGDLKVGKTSDIILTFTDDGDPVTDLTSVHVIMELRDDNNDPVEADKVVPFIGITYEEGDPITAGPWEAMLEDNNYVFSTEADDDNDVKGIAKAGNWHYIITATRGNTTYNYDVMESTGTGDFGFTKTQTQLIFATGLFFFALFTIFGGRLSKKFGPRNIAIAGGAVLGAGYILASFMGSSFIGLLFSIGILGGVGIGLGYVVPIAVGVKWFPDKKGLISGLAVAGFGFGALLWIKLATGFKFGPVDLTPGWGGLLSIDSIGVSEVFLIYGIAFAATVIAGGLLMKNPPEGWKPKGWEPPVPKEGDDNDEATGHVEFTSKEMIRTPQYWMLFFMFMIGAGAGLMVIGVIGLFGKDALVENGYTRAEAVTIAGTAMALFYSLANGIGRIAWGAISDKIGRKWAFVTMFSIQGIMMLAFFFIGGNEYLLYLGAALVGFNFGGNFALFPSATADFFGNKSVGLNYGFVFFSYGIGGILGPMLGGIMGDMNLWIWAFIPAGIGLLISAVLAFLLKSPKKKE